VRVLQWVRWLLVFVFLMLALVSLLLVAAGSSSEEADCSHQDPHDCRLAKAFQVAGWGGAAVFVAAGVAVAVLPAWRRSEGSADGGKQATPDHAEEPSAERQALRWRDWSG
jgi:hypothetical protein